METENLLQELAKPFSPEHISWKPGSLTKDNSKCMALAYADLRAYQDRLDQVCGLDWSCRFVPWTNNRIICELTIAGVTRSSTGESNAQDEKNGMAGSVAEAMAYKRACAAFGLGRFLYDLPSVWIEFDAQAKRISKAGQAELDKRYADWYRRATGQPAPDPTPVAASSNGKPAPKPAAKLAQKPATALNGAKADNPFESEEDDSMERLVALGVEVYADEWKTKSKVLAEHVTTGTTDDIRKLTAAERLKLIKGMENKLKELAAAEAA